MTKQLYHKYLNNLEKALGLPNSIELDDFLGATLISNHTTPLVINIRYDLSEGKIIIQTPITTHFPKSRLGVQTIMNKLVGDLLAQNRNIGRLIADRITNSIEFVKFMDIDLTSENALADFFPLFIKQALSWRQKFDQVTQKSQKISFNREKEIVSFTRF